MNKIKQGYKQTDIGVIPEEWKVKPIGKLGLFSKGNGISRAESNTGIIPCVRYGEIYTTHDNYIKKFYSFISREVANRAKKLKVGDVLFTASGETKEDIGKNVAFIDDIEAYAGGDIIILSPKNADSLFLGYLFNAPYVVTQKANKGQGDAVVHITKDSLRDIVIAIPESISEQTAIATALSDTDALIAALDKKIAKKQQIKQGAMQQLLTGKKRLPGFSGEWVEKKFGELLDYEQPTDYIVKSTDYLTQGIPVLTAGKSFILGYTAETTGIFTNSPVIIFDDFTTATKFVDFKFKVKSSAMKILKLRESNNSIKLIYELMQLIDFPLIDHQRYWISEYSKIIVKIPATSEEQTVIAQILTDMDKEIARLEKERDKYKEIKAGMMQVLLTGKVRLV